MLPQGLAALFVMAWRLKEGPGCGHILLGLTVVLLYPLAVPIPSIYWAALELIRGEDKEEALDFMKGLKIFEHLGKGRGKIFTLGFRVQT